MVPMSIPESAEPSRQHASSVLQAAPRAAASAVRPESLLRSRPTLATTMNWKHEELIPHSCTLLTVIASLTDFW